MDILDELPEADEEALALFEEFRASAKEPLPLPDVAYEKFSPFWGEE
ncbi:MAG TPA: hypothetical protein PK490_02945 [Prosthecobacter sp.]|nr:hypothetical protein [Prosthecobacter sp.]HRK13215.1 hypothetical protein [Prosthecobacter sp.]